MKFFEGEFILKKELKKGKKFRKRFSSFKTLAGTDPRNISDLINSRAMKDLIPLEPLFKGKHYE